MIERLFEIVDRFSDARIAVVGDMVADVYIYGEPVRLSREAPVLVVRYEDEKLVPGSAANVANNLVTLGATVFPIGVVGDDEPGNGLCELLAKKGVDTSGLVIDGSTSTITKTRIVAGDRNTSKQQMLCIYREPPEDNVPPEALILEKIDAVTGTVDALIASDYGYKVLSAEVIKRLRESFSSVPVLADSRFGLGKFGRFTIVKPNEAEAEALTGIECGIDDVNLPYIGKRLLDMLEPEMALVTLGNRGMAMFEPGKEVREIPVAGTTVGTDVSGAGDTVTTVLALARVSGASYYEAAVLANYAAGVVVMKRGTAALTLMELKEMIGRENG